MNIPRTVYDPRLYDVLYSDYRVDVEWYRTLALRLGGRVLELGAGTGRTLLPLAVAGLEVCGIEIAPEMLAAFEERLEGETAAVRSRVRLVLGDMTRFDVPGRYRLVQIPFHVFPYNLDRESQLSCLRSCARHLEAGGTLAFDVPRFDDKYIQEQAAQPLPPWRLARETVGPDGGWIQWSVASTFRLEAQTYVSRIRYDRYTADGRLQSSQLMRRELAILKESQLRDLVREAGFAEVQIFGGFDERATSEKDNAMLVMAKKLGA